jgi:hypothetical protein
MHSGVGLIKGNPNPSITDSTLLVDQLSSKGCPKGGGSQQTFKITKNKNPHQHLA